MTPRLLYRYDRRKVRLAILAAQVMGIIALYWTTRVVEIGPHRGMVLYVAFLTLPILIYLAFFALTVMVYVRRDLIAIYADGTMTIKWMRDRHVKLPMRTIVDYDDKRLALTTSLPKVWFAKNRDGVVTLPMPNMLCSVGEGQFVIGEGVGHDLVSDADGRAMMPADRTMGGDPKPPRNDEPLMP